MLHIYTTINKLLKKNENYSQNVSTKIIKTTLYVINLNAKSSDRLLFL